MSRDPSFVGWCGTCAKWTGRHRNSVYHCDSRGRNIDHRVGHKVTSSVTVYADGRFFLPRMRVRLRYWTRFLRSRSAKRQEYRQRFQDLNTAIDRSGYGRDGYRNGRDRNGFSYHGVR